MAFHILHKNRFRYSPFRILERMFYRIMLFMNIQKEQQTRLKNEIQMTEHSRAGFGSLTQYLGLRKVNTKGLSQGNKCMHMAAIAYNLKKYLKFVSTYFRVRQLLNDKSPLKRTFYLLFWLFFSICVTDTRVSGSVIYL